MFSAPIIPLKLLVWHASQPSGSGNLHSVLFLTKMNPSGHISNEEIPPLTHWGPNINPAFPIVLVTVIIAMLKHHDQKQVVEERIYLTYIYTL